MLLLLLSYTQYVFALDYRFLYFLKAMRCVRIDFISMFALDL